MKKFIITDEQRTEIFYLINQRRTLQVKKIINDLEELKEKKPVEKTKENGNNKIK